MTVSGRTRFLPRLRRPSAAASLLFAVIVAASPASAASPSFSAFFVAYPTGAGPGSVAIVDLDGDGKLDVVTANGAAGTVSVLLGNGNGTLQGHVDYPTGPACGTVHIADFNSDGVPDVAAASSAKMFILISNGDGTLRPVTQLPNLEWFIGDVNGDGKPDLLAPGPKTPSGGDPNLVGVRLGVGDGTFGPVTSTPFGEAIDAVGDLDRDGRLDLVTHYRVRDPHDADAATVYLHTMLGNGDGSFRPGTELAQFAEDFHDYERVANVIVGDVNGDGIPVVTYGKRYTCTPDCSGDEFSFGIMAGNDDGTFQEIGGGVGNPLAICGASGGGSWYVVSWQLQHGVLTRARPAGTQSLPIYSAGIAIGDLSGDGQPDLAWVGSGDQVAVAIGNGDLTFGKASERLLSFSPDVMTCGDLDGDGKVDLMARHENLDPGSGLGLSAMLDGGEGGTIDYAGIDGAAFSLGDVNADGRLDLAVTRRDQGIRLMVGDGRGAFGPGREVLFTTGGMTAIGDFNGDGWGDLVVPDANIWGLAVLLGSRDGTFSPTLFEPPRFTTVATGDLNLDGHLDLVLGSALEVSVMLGDGLGNFSPRVDVATSQAPDYLTIGDLNGDQIPDILAGDASSTSVLLVNGMGGFVQATQVPEGGRPAIGDLNGDGATDVVFPRGSGVAVLLGANDGTFGAPAFFGTAGLRSKWVGIADRNGDGRPDLTVVSGGLLYTYDNGPTGYRFGAYVSVLFQNASETTPIALSLASTEVTSDMVRLTWWSEGAADLRTIVQRSDPGTSEWAEIGSPSISGADRLVFEDHAVTPGLRYGYRLAVMDGGQETLSEPVWVTVPMPAVLALAGAAPNPSDAGVSVRFSLPGNQPARLELFDLHGRLVAQREVGSLGPGEHQVPLADGAHLPAGVYLVRLTQDRRVLTSKACVVN